jgi:hypothetical protein
LKNVLPQVPIVKEAGGPDADSQQEINEEEFYISVFSFVEHPISLSDSPLCISRGTLLFQ